MLKSCIRYLKEDVLVNDEIVCCLIHTKLKRNKVIYKTLIRYFNTNYDIIDICDTLKNEITKEQLDVIENKVLQMNCFAVKIISLINDNESDGDVVENINRMKEVCESLNEDVEAIKQLI